MKEENKIKEELPMIKDDLIAITQKAKTNSCTDKVIPIKGSFYVSHDKLKQSKIRRSRKNILAIVTATMALTAALTVGSAMDTADEIREEATKKVTVQNSIGGQLNTKNVHDDEFIDYISSLNSFELNRLFGETADDMDNNNITDIVNQMEENYLESKEKGNSK